MWSARGRAPARRGARGASGSGGSAAARRRRASSASPRPRALPGRTRRGCTTTSSAATPPRRCGSPPGRPPDGRRDRRDAGPTRGSHCRTGARSRSRAGGGRRRATTTSAACRPTSRSCTETRTASTGDWYIATPTLSLRHGAVALRRHLRRATASPSGGTGRAGVPIDAKLLPGPTVALRRRSPPRRRSTRCAGSTATFARRVVSPDGHIDDHELQRAANGDFLYLVYDPKRHVDLTPFGGPADGTVLEAKIEEVPPAGTLVWSWSTDGARRPPRVRARLPDSPRRPRVIEGGEQTYDFFHANAVALGGSTVLLSLRQTDGVYAIDRATGADPLEARRTPTPQSHTVVGDPFGDAPLGGQHDARLLPDGTVTRLRRRHLPRPRAARRPLPDRPRRADGDPARADRPPRGDDSSAAAPRGASRTATGSSPGAAIPSSTIPAGRDARVPDRVRRPLLVPIVAVAGSPLSAAALRAGMDAMA